jgi:hypothetical protein
MARKNKLLRYELEQSISCGKPMGHFKISKEGQWVYWNDVAPYIKESLRTSTNSAMVPCEYHEWLRLGKEHTGFRWCPYCRKSL